MKKFVSVLVVLVMVFAFVGEVMATEASGPAVDTAKKTTEYSKDVVKGTAKSAGEAVVGTGQAAVSPFAALGNWLTGKGKAKNIVTDPVNKTGETINKAAVNTGKTVQGKK
jgi:hypothetical protein